MINSTEEYIKNTVLAPLLSLIDELAIPALVNYSMLSYPDHYSKYMGPLPYGHLAVESFQFGSRLIPRSVLESNNAGFNAVAQNLTAHGVLIVGSAGNYTAPHDVSNSVLPAWRKATIQLQLTTPWIDNEWHTMEMAQDRMTDEFVPQMAAITPGSGAYMNEADYQQPDWKSTFFGSNYAALWAIKLKWDPLSLFYVLKGVGSDAWTVSSSGRMCRAIPVPV